MSTMQHALHTLGLKKIVFTIKRPFYMVQGLMPLLQSNKLINPSLIIATCTQRILLNIKRYKVGKKSKNL